MRFPASIALQSAALLGAAAVCALVSNGLARPERRLAWTAAPPPVAEGVPAALPAPAQALAAPAEPVLAPAPMPGPGAVRGPQSPEALTPLPVAPAVVFAARPGQSIREITSDEAGEAFKAGAPFLDARRSAEFEAGHVQGAWSLPIWESSLEERLIEFEAQAARPPEAALVLYCSGGDCEDSHLLAARLFRMGYRNLLIYRDGYPDWTGHGRPTTKGAVR